jgi:hypothetical protein
MLKRQRAKVGARCGLSKETVDAEHLHNEGKADFPSTVLSAGDQMRTFASLDLGKNSAAGNKTLSRRVCLS